jgi:hypothetical protein
MRWPLLLAVVSLHCVTAGTYGQWYTDRLGGQRVDARPDLVPARGDPKVYQGDDLEQDNQKMMKNGFVQIGISAFNDAQVTPAENVRRATDWARYKQAEVVLIYSSFTGTLTEQVPYQVATGEDTSTWTRYDRHGNPHDHTETTTTYETQLQEVQTDRYDYTATFWVKKRTRTDEPMTATATTHNGIFTVMYPPSFTAENKDDNTLVLTRTLDDGGAEVMVFEAYQHPISTDLREFARVVENGVHAKQPGFALRSSQVGKCYGLPGVVTTATYHPQNGPAEYWTYACDAITPAGAGIRASFNVPVTHATDHEDMLLRMVGAAKLSSATGASAAGEELTQTYSTKDGRITVRYPASFAASPQADGSLLVRRSDGATVSFRALAPPSSSSLQQVVDWALGETQRTIGESGGTMGEVRQTPGQCLGNSAVLTSHTFTLKGLAVDTWHCIFLKDGAAYSFGYSMPQNTSQGLAPLLKQIVQAAKINAAR